MTRLQTYNISGIKMCVVVQFHIYNYYNYTFYLLNCCIVNACITLLKEEDILTQLHLFDINMGNQLRNRLLVYEYKSPVSSGAKDNDIHI